MDKVDQPVENRQDDRSLGDLFKALTQDFSNLVRQEVNLAHAELLQRTRRLSTHAATVAAGGALAHAGALALVACLMCALALGLHLAWWASALLVGVLAEAAGLAMIRQGIEALKHEDLVPRRTLETLKEDARWAKDQLS